MRTTLRLNVDNLADKAYWMTSAGTLLQGAPRSVKLSAQLEY
jgi:iron complex outermembrane receptor protein